MNARLAKWTSLLFLSPLLALTQPSAHAQGTTPVEVSPSPANGRHANDNPRYEIEITNKKLLLAQLKGRPDVKAIWGKEDLQSVPATLDNLAKYLKAVNPDLNIVLSPGTAEQTIGDLKIRSGDMNALVEAIGIATDNAVRGTSLSGKDNWTFMAQMRSNRRQQQVEVFNLSGYIQTLNTSDEKVINDKLEELKFIIQQTLADLTIRQKGEYSSTENPDFRFHTGTRLLIVMGNPDAIDVARKIVNALPGQSKPSREDLLDLTHPQNQK